MIKKHTFLLLSVTLAALAAHNLKADNLEAAGQRAFEALMAQFGDYTLDFYDDYWDTDNFYWVEGDFIAAVSFNQAPSSWFSFSEGVLVMANEYRLYPPEEEFAAGSWLDIRIEIHFFFDGQNFTDRAIFKMLIIDWSADIEAEVAEAGLASGTEITEEISFITDEWGYNAVIEAAIDLIAAYLEIITLS
ncbi:MAG: hypothetical protein FWE37_05005 [Spirochaetaceae bacterium]|nr:hypothetical protein [Spirochaetaceae bacterium]